MGELYTCGEWIVKPGREDEFVEAWNGLARWTTAEVEGAGPGTLVQDRERPNVFLSFGPWRDEQAIDGWRARPEFQQHVAAISELCEQFTPGTFEKRGP